ncbi:MAG: hypothetical protein QOI80_1976, partial [Solirubrobacteraceae bacterium]|nr:hypothetical protein [Solirubrobacteraceae bacterium]
MTSAAPLAAYSASLFERVMRASGRPLASGMSVLDFGCGD